MSDALAWIARLLDRCARLVLAEGVALKTYLAALLAITFMMRWPSLAYPLGPDESGYLLVARHWRPTADSVYGPFFVDRTPVLIAAFRGIDELGGDVALRVVGAMAALVLVAAVAAVGWIVADEVGTGATGRDHAARWAAVAAAAWSTSTMLGSMYTKGEILGIPLVALSFLCALMALRAQGAVRQVLLAGSAGLMAALAVGLKQNMLSGLAFGGVLLLGAAITRRISWGRFAGLATAALIGAAVPVVATIAWARAAGVHLSEVWYVSVAFRDDASSVLAAGSFNAPLMRGIELFAAAVAAGLVLAIAVLLLDVRHLWRVNRALTAAIIATVAVDIVGLSLGGSYWRPYLLNLIPGACIGIALVVACGHDHRTPVATATGSTDRSRWMQWCVVVAVAAGLIASVGSAGKMISRDDMGTGEAIEAQARPGDTIMTFGGQAGIVYQSGLTSHYPYLWSLPMRVLDPDLELMRSQLTGQSPPTWFVLAVPLDSWSIPASREVRAILRRDYVYDGDSCGDRIYRLREVERVAAVCPR